MGILYNIINWLIYNTIGKYMGKLFTPQDVSSGFNTTNSLNTNFDNIETALDRTLSRYGETPNAMESDLDMNNNDLLNAGLVSCDTLEVGGAEIPTLQSLQDLLDEAESDLQDQVDLAQGYSSSASQSAIDAVTAQGLAEAAQAAAEAAVVSVDLPIIQPGDDGKYIVALSDTEGYALEWRRDQVFSAIGDTVVLRDEFARGEIATPVADLHIANKLYVDTNKQFNFVATVGRTSLNTFEDPDFFTTYGNGLYMIDIQLTQDNIGDTFKLQFAQSGSTYITASTYNWDIGGFAAGAAVYDGDEAVDHIQLTTELSSEDVHLLRLFVSNNGGVSSISRLYRVAGSSRQGKYAVEASLNTLNTITGFKIYGPSSANTIANSIKIYKALFRE